MNRKLKTVAFMLFVGVLLGVTSSQAQMVKRVRLPFFLNNPPNVEAKEMRLDNIEMWQLDQRLQEFGITSATDRQWIYNTEQTRRNSGGSYGTAPEGYPGPESTPDVTGYLPLPCFQGQGCHVVWTGMGTMQSHFREVIHGWMPWTNGIRCPSPKVCSVLASIPADMSLPATNQRQYIGFGTMSFGVPVYNGRQCFWVV